MEKIAGTSTVEDFPLPYQWDGLLLLASETRLSVFAGARTDQKRRIGGANAIYH